MNELDARALPDPASAPKASRRDRKRAAKILQSTANYFDLAPEDRTSVQAEFFRAIQLDPHNSHGWFDLGIHLKQACRWEETALCNRRAIDLADVGEGSPEFWNLGIASTALGDWQTARYAWANYGAPLAEGTGEIREDLGPSPVRVCSPEGHLEVVWGTRICPARIQVRNVPLPRSGHRWHDIVLHDGAPNGYRTSHGRDYPVFDELQRWRPSDIATLECLVQGADDDIFELLEMFPSDSSGVEDWTTSIEMLCRECSEGHPSPDHKHGNFLASVDGRTIGIAAERQVAEQIFDQWIAAGPGRSRSDIFNAEATT